MNLDIFNKIDPSGRLCKEHFLIKNHNSEYTFIINYCSDYDLEVPFREKVYLCLNDIKKLPICSKIDCNSPVKYQNLKLGYRRYCSVKCGIGNTEVLEKRKNNSLLKYGYESPSQSLEVKQKSLKTNIERYGGVSAMSSKITQEKSRKTCIKNWGVDNPNKSKELLEKRVISFKKNSDEWQRKMRNTCLERYGNENPMKLELFSNKSKELSVISKNKKLYESISEKLDNRYKLISIDYDFFKRNINIDCYKGHQFSINREQLYNRQKESTLICTVCNPLVLSSSGLELILSEFIKENSEFDILSNSRKIIKPYEIDIFIENLKIGFEFNGLYWHSSKYKDSNYHYTKYKIALDNDIKLYTIWEDDWLYKQEICKSFILNKLNKTPNSIYARRCLIKNVSYKESKEFLENNHLQGNCVSSIRIGLYFNDNLVSLMTFGKMRLPMGGKNTEGVYELTRFCNICYTNVVGGASKMLNFFIKTNKVSEIHTYSDNMISDGNLYSKLGFKQFGESRPGYWYIIDGIRSHRFNWRKSKLKKLGYDTSKSEELIMNDLGYFRIYGCGNKKWIYTV